MPGDSAGVFAEIPFDAVVLLERDRAMPWCYLRKT